MIPNQQSTATMDINFIYIQLYTNFFTACRDGDFETVKQLVSKGFIDPTVENHFGKSLAETYGHTQIVAWLAIQK